MVTSYSQNVIDTALPPPTSEPATRLRFAVRGMTCASCVGHVERALKGVAGVSDVSVNLALERAEVTAPASLAARVAETIAEEGYEARAIAAGASASSEQARRAAEHAAQEAALKRNLILAALLSLPVVILEMGGHLFAGFHHWQAEMLGEATPRWIAFALTALVLAFPGRRFFRIGFGALMRGKPEMNALVALGSGAAFLYSAAATLAPGLFPDGGAHVYFESAAVIVTLILTGRLIEARSKGRTGAAIRELVALQPETATRLKGSIAVETPVSEIMVGDLVLVKPGAGVPVDGEVVEGSSYVHEAVLTGEPIPAPKRIGSRVHGGSVNGAGALTIRATKVGDETLLAGVIRLVEQAQGSKLPIQARIDKVTAVFVPIVLAVAAVTFITWLALGPSPSLPFALITAVSVLIIACPCAMGLATPISVVVATGRAAQLGALFRTGEALERLAGARIVAFDKTGTLTRGRPELVHFMPGAGVHDNEALALAAAVEQRSEHPIARAITAAAALRGLAAPPAHEVQALTGLGVVGEVAGARVLVGGPALMTCEDLDLAPWRPAMEERAQRGETAFFVARDGQILALLTVADPIKPGVRAVIDDLKGMGLTPAMISGDQEATARAVARTLGIETVIAGVLPAGKVEALKSLQTQGPVVFVGDGVNDAPALAAADTGVAVGDGTTVAIESADVVLVSSDLATLVHAVGLARAALANMKQNLIWAFGYNVALIPVAAGLFWPVFGWSLSPMLAAAAMAFSSVFVVLNALRLKDFARTPPPSRPDRPAPAGDALPANAA
jgi:heavy metal translocating P-type ATPase